LFQIVLKMVIGLSWFLSKIIYRFDWFNRVVLSVTLSTSGVDKAFCLLFWAISTGGPDTTPLRLGSGGTAVSTGGPEMV
jgi:hypothetical protein